MRCLAAVLAAAACLALPGVQSQEVECERTDSDITCAACLQGAGINALDGVPRVNRAFEPVPSNLGELEWFECQDEASLQACDASGGGSCYETCSLVDVQGDLTGDAPATSPAAAVEGWAIYSGVAMLFALLWCMWSLAFCVGRYCCCCVKGGICGKRHPTLRTHFLGFEPRPPFHYRAVEVWGAQGLMWAYAAFVAIFVIVGNVQGNAGFTEAQKTMIRAPNGLVSTVQGLSNPVSNLMVSVAGRLAVPGITALNATITDAVDLDVVQSKLQCITDSIGNAIPDLDVVNGTVNDADNSLNLARGNITAVNSTLLGLDEELAEAQARIAAADEVLADFEVGVGNVSTSMGDLRVEVLGVKTPYVDEWSSSTVGLGAMSDGVNDLNNLPTDGEVVNSTAACTAGGTAARENGALGSPSYMGRDSDLADIATALMAFDDAGDIGGLAANLQAHNERRDYFLNNQTADRVVDATLALNDSLNALPELSLLRSRLEDLEGLLSGGFNGTSEASANVQDLNTTLFSFPSLTPIVDELARVTNIEVTITCALEMLEELGNLNASVIRLPDTVNEIPNTLNSVNDTRAEVDATIADLTATSQQLDETTANISSTLTTALSQLNAVEEQQSRLSSGNSTFNFTALYSDIDALEASLASLNLTSLIDGVVALNDSLADPAVVAPAPLILGLTTLANEIEELRAAQTAYMTYHSTGVCSVGNTACDPTLVTSCGGTCESGVRLCSDRTTPCTANSDCGAGTCFFQQAVIQDGAMAYVRAGFDAGPLGASLSSAADALDSVPDLDAQVATLDDARANIDGLDLSGYRAQLAQLSSELSVSGDTEGNSTSGGESPLQASLTDARTQLDSFALDEVQGTLTEMNTSLATLDESLDTLDRFSASITAMQDFLFRDTGVAQELAELSEARLDEVRAADGLDGMMLHVAQQMQGMVVKLNSIESGFSEGGGNGSLADTDLVKQLNDTGILDTVRVLTTDEYSQHGGIYFFSSLAGGSDSTVDPTTTSEGTLALDANGNEYAEGKQCFTETCLDNTIEAANRAPLSEGAGVLPAGTIPVPLDRETIFFLPYVPVLLIMLIGVVGTINCFGGGWQSWTTCCSAVLISVCAPILFFIVGGIFFPMSLVAHDICRGGPNVAYQYAVGSQHALCVSFGGTPDLATGLCAVPVVGASNATFELNIPDLAAAVLGDCSHAPAAFDNFYTSLDDAFTDAPLDSVNSTVEGSQGAAGAIQHRLAADLRGMARNTSGVMSLLLADVADSLGCEAVNNNGYKPFKDALCCDVMDAYYWYVNGLYMCAFSMVLCGWWASILGRKRFVGKLWGPDVDHAKKSWELTAEGGAGEGGVVIDLGDHVEGGDLLSGDGSAAFPPAAGNGDIPVVNVGPYAKGEDEDFAGAMLAQAEANEAGMPGATAPPPGNFAGSNPMHSKQA